MCGFECQQGLSPISINAAPREHPLCNLALPLNGISRYAFLGKNVSTGDFLPRLARVVFNFRESNRSRGFEKPGAKHNSRSTEAEQAMQSGRDARSARNLQNFHLILTSNSGVARTTVRSIARAIRSRSGGGGGASRSRRDPLYNPPNKLSPIIRTRDLPELTLDVTDQDIRTRRYVVPGPPVCIHKCNILSSYPP